MRRAIPVLGWFGVLSSATACAFLACGGGGALAPQRIGGDAGTPSDASAPGADASNADGDASEGGLARTLALASGGVELLVSGPTLGFQLTPANLATDADAIEIHQEYYGIPWSTFAAGAAPPPEWKAVMDSIAASAQSMGKPVFLSVTMLNGNRTSLSAETIIQNGQVQTQDGWAANCYDFASAPDAASMKQAYLAYVDWMIAEFSPRWLNIAVEVNLFFEHCPSAIAGVIDVANAAYDEAKAKNASLIVFPSIQIDHLYGYATGSCADPSQQAACFDANYAQIAPLERDRFAMSTYPMLGVFGSPAGIPSDWFTRGSSRGGERPLVAETGWDSSPVVIDLKSGACDTVFASSESDAEAYLAFLLASASSANMDLVNWWSNRDLVDATLMTNCPCNFDPNWCAALDVFRGPAPDGGDDGGDPQAFGELLLKGFGAMGVREYDGGPKAALMTAWQAARVVPWAPQ